MIKVSFYITVLLLGFNLSICYSQSRSSYWPLGYQSYTVFTDVGGLTVDFPNNTFNFYDHPREMWFRFANTAICNDSGALQFYTNGVYIANAVDDTMLNGSGINPSVYTTQFYQSGLRLPQAVIIIPKPGNDSLYYLFHETKDITFGASIKRANYLYSSTINMNGDSGKGEVINKNNVLVMDTLFVGGLTTCKHANGRDWWLLVPEYGNSLGYYTLLITPDTIQIYSHNYYPLNGLDIGQACFSPDGSKYVLSYWWGVAFFEFDRCNGNLVLKDNVVWPDSLFCLGASVSPNSRYAYITHGFDLVQYDLSATNVAASGLVVATYDGFQAPAGWPTNFFMHQIAPDGKIYINTTSSTLALNLINQPDSAGLLCDVQQHAVIFPKFNYSIPTFPNYDLGRLQGSPCDTLLWTGVAPLSRGEGPGVRLSPNPASNSVNIKYDIATNQNMLFVLYDSYGKEVLRKTLYGTFKNLLVATDMLPDGVYFYSATVEKAGIRETGKLVVVH